MSTLVESSGLKLDGVEPLVKLLQEVEDDYAKLKNWAQKFEIASPPAKVVQSKRRRTQK